MQTSLFVGEIQINNLFHSHRRKPGANEVVITIFVVSAPNVLVDEFVHLSRIRPLKIYGDSYVVDYTSRIQTKLVSLINHLMESNRASLFFSCAKHFTCLAWELRLPSRKNIMDVSTTQLIELYHSNFVPEIEPLLLKQIEGTQYEYYLCTHYAHYVI